MRIDTKKVRILGPMSRKEAFFEDIQRYGIAQFFSETKETPIAVNEDIQRLIDALHILRTMPVAVSKPRSTEEALLIAVEIIESKKQLENAYEKKRLLSLEMERLNPLGYFSLSRIHSIEKQANRVFQFFCAQPGEPLTPLNQHPNLIYISTANELHYYLSIAPEPMTYPGCSEMIVHQSLGHIESLFVENEKNIDYLERQLSQLNHYKEVLKRALLDALNRDHLHHALHQCNIEVQGALFSCSAWVPKNKTSLLYHLADKHDLLVLLVPITSQDQRPTYLENKTLGSLGEELIAIYETPSASDRDPSTWVVISFIVFFSLIIGDAGYGLILLGLCRLISWKIKNITTIGRKLLMLGKILALGCILWGILTTSFFGIPISPFSPLKKISISHWMAIKKSAFVMKHKDATFTEIVTDYPEIEQQTDPLSFATFPQVHQETSIKYVFYDQLLDNVMLEISLFIGTLHILCSLCRYVDRNWASGGWIIFLLGGYLYAPSVLKATSLIHYIFMIPPEFGAQIGLVLLYSGIGLATLGAIIQHKWKGLATPMEMIQVFSDVMSYLRIYALMLAGSIMANTFDSLGLKTPIFLGIFIIIVGHTVNFLLAIMGGVIHGLRLNFIEWYHYSFEGGGKKFTPLRIVKYE